MSDLIIKNLVIVILLNSEKHINSNNIKCWIWIFGKSPNPPNWKEWFLKSSSETKEIPS